MRISKSVELGSLIEVKLVVEIWTQVCLLRSTIARSSARRISRTIRPNHFASLWMQPCWVSVWALMSRYNHLSFTSKSHSLMRMLVCLHSCTRALVNLWFADRIRRNLLRSTLWKTLARVCWLSVCVLSCAWFWWMFQVLVAGWVESVRRLLNSYFLHERPVVRSSELESCSNRK